MDRSADLTSCEWLPLSACVDRPAGQVGRKAGSLARAANAGMRTPGGHVLPAEFLWAVLERCGAAGKVRYLARSALSLDPAHVLAIAAQVAEAMEDGVVDADALKHAEALFVHRPALPLVCRSSAAMEDGVDSAFPGLFTSILNIASPAELARAIARCWRSAFGADLVRYILRVRPTRLDFSLALLVQPLVAAPRYGICFSEDPMGRVPGSIIQLSDATPEALVHGAPASQSFMYHKGRWAGDTALPPPLRHLPDILSKLSSQVGSPVDLEFALDDPTAPPILFQVRPISRRASGKYSICMPPTRSTLPGTGCAPGRAAGMAGADILLLREVAIEDYARIMSASAIAAVADTSPLGHVAILCRELGIPLVTGLGETLLSFTGAPLVVDGDLGVVGLLTVEERRDPVARPAESGAPDALSVGIDELNLRCLTTAVRGRSDPMVLRDVMADLSRIGGTKNIRVDYGSRTPE